MLRNPYGIVVAVGIGIGIILSILLWAVYGVMEDGVIFGGGIGIGIILWGVAIVAAVRGIIRAIRPAGMTRDPDDNG